MTSPPLSVAALTGGRSVPSARFRVRQLIEPLANEGIAVREWRAAFSSYPPQSEVLRPLWLAGSLAQRLPQVLLSHRCDAVLLQRELMSTLFTLERWTRRPRILDVDDAVWLHPRGAFAAKLAAACDAVVCGNAFLAEYFSRVNRRVTVIPTAVDTEAYAPASGGGAERHGPVVGWIGTGANLHYLAAIEPALGAFLRGVPEARLRIMADRPPRLPSLPAERVTYQPWSAAAELSMLQDLTVGIMPLEDTPWTRGKCSFKMLMYMSCGVPAVVSPVGMNREVLALGPGALAAATRDQWVEALTGLCRDPQRAAELGARGRALVEAHFSVRSVAPRLARAVQEVVRGR